MKRNLFASIAVDSRCCLRLLRSGRISLFDGQEEWSVLAGLVGLALFIRDRRKPIPPIPLQGS
ncbi:hypothetical protein PO124_23190 [Bacillus licheniformis]|nr:hypothetical protein [Bacillus licheniformis]